MASSRRSGTNEVVKTYHSGGGYDYSSLNTWESAYDVDNVTNTQSPVLEIKAGNHDDTIDIQSTDGYNDATYHRILRPVSGEGHNGIPKFDGSMAAFTSTTDIADHFKVDGGDIYFEFQDLVITYKLAGIRNDSYALSISTGNIFAIGCIVIDCTSDNDNRAFKGQQNGGTIYFINCMSINNDRGFMGIATTTYYVYNCTAEENTEDDFKFDSNTVGGNITNCIGAITDLSGNMVQTTNSATATYKDSANDDFHINPADTNVRHQGTDLSADGNFPFDDDINDRDMGASKAGQNRVGSWDIGADQYVQRINT